MWRNEFERLCKWAVYVSMLREDFMENLKLRGVDLQKEIPSAFLFSKNLEKFCADRESNGFAYAAFQQRVFIESVSVDSSLSEKVSGVTDDVFVQLFLEAQKIFLAEQLAAKIIRSPQDADKFLAEYIEKKTESLEVLDLKTAYKDYCEEHNALVKEGTVVLEVPTFEILSKTIGGFNPQRLIILLAESGYGKTTLAMNLALRMSEKYSSLFLNMEMGKYDFMTRVIAMKNKISFSDAKKSINPVYVNEDTLNLNFHFTDGRGMNMAQISALARKYKKQHNIRFLVVDYDQKIVFENESEEQWKQLQKASVKLEELAKELKICVLLCAQVNTEGKISGSHRSKFAASAVLNFENHDEYGSVIYATKNRHGENYNGVIVDYKKAYALIEETRGVVIGKKSGAKKKV